MFGIELIKFMRRCLLVYSLALLALGFILGLTLHPARHPAYRDFPAASAPDQAALATRRA